MAKIKRRHFLKAAGGMATAVLGVSKKALAQFMPVAMYNAIPFLKVTQVSFSALVKNDAVTSAINVTQVTKSALVVNGASAVQVTQTAKAALIKGDLATTNMQVTQVAKVVAVTLSS